MMTAVKTFFLSSGFPFLTDARKNYPTDPFGSLLSLAPILVQAIIYRFLAPVLSAQFITQATGIPHEILNLIPLLPPLALLDMIDSLN